MVEDEPKMPMPPLPPSELEEDLPDVPVEDTLRPPTAADLKIDAEELRNKAALVLEDDRALAKKYLLASTILDNTSVDVWMTLARLAGSDKERAAFLREAEKVMKRGQG